MSVVSLLSVKILNNPAKFTDSYEFEITFECLEQLKDDLEWKLTYVGSAATSEYDQELDSLLVGPVPVGVNKFIFEADAPDFQRLPASDILGVTVILLTCSYATREFVRVGYYVNNEYDSPELNETPPAKPIIEKVKRNVLAEKPRVTRFAIKWDSEESAPAEYPPEQPEADIEEDDGANYGAEEEEEETAEVLEDEKPVEEDAEMDGADETAGPAAAAAVDAEEDDEAGSEDLEAESSGSEDEEEEEEEGAEGEADEEMDLGEEESGKANGAAAKPHEAHAQDEMMVH